MEILQILQLKLLRLLETMGSFTNCDRHFCHCLCSTNHSYDHHGYGEHDCKSHACDCKDQNYHAYDCHHDNHCCSHTCPRSKNLHDQDHGLYIHKMHGVGNANTTLSPLQMPVCQVYRMNTVLHPLWFLIPNKTVRL